MKIKGTNEVIGITGMSLGLGLIGDSLGGDIGGKIGQAGVTSSNFISPMVNISMGGHVIKQLKNLKV
jgi:hypothetical protein